MLEAAARTAQTDTVTLLQIGKAAALTSDDTEAQAEAKTIFGRLSFTQKMQASSCLKMISEKKDLLIPDRGYCCLFDEVVSVQELYRNVLDAMEEV